MITIDVDGAILSFNRAAEETFGFDRESAVGRPLSELVIPPELRSAHWAAMARQKAGGDSRILNRRLELIAMRADGSRFPAEVRVATLDADPPTYIGFVRDVSVLAERERRARHLDELLAQAELATHVGTWEWRPVSGDVIWSDASYRIHGYEPGAVTPTIELATQLTHPDDRGKLEAAIEAALEGSPPRSLEYRIVRGSGEVRDVVARVFPVGGDVVPPAMMAGTLQDVTEARAHEREIEGYYAAGHALVEWRARKGIDHLLRDLAVAMGWEAAALWIPDRNEGVIRGRGFWAPPGLDADALENSISEVAFPEGRGLPGLAWKREEPVEIEDLDGEQEPTLRSAAAAGLPAAVAIPGCRSSGVVGVVELFGRNYHPLDHGMRRALKVLGYQLGYFLDRSRAAVEPAKLTPREIEVLVAAADGRTSQQIAEHLVISPETVKTHLGSIYTKLDVADRAQAVARALRSGLIE